MECSIKLFRAKSYPYIHYWLNRSNLNPVFKANVSQLYPPDMIFKINKSTKDLNLSYERQ